MTKKAPTTLGLVERSVLIDWLQPRVSIEGDCWIWRLSTCRNNQPRATLNGKSSTSVRKYIWQCCHPDSPPPKGKVTQPSCGEPLCVAPDHIVMRSKSVAQKIHAKRGVYSKPGPLAKRTATLRAGGKIERIKHQVRQDREAGMYLHDLAKKYEVTLTTIYRCLDTRRDMPVVAANSSVFAWMPAA